MTKFWEDNDEIKKEMKREFGEWLDEKNDELRELIENHKNELSEKMAEKSEELMAKFDSGKIEWDDNDSPTESVVRDVISDVKSEVVGNIMYSTRESDWQQSLNYDTDF